MPTAIRASTLISSLGVNTHLDYPNTPYANLAIVEQDLSYLGVHIARDAAMSQADITLWQQVAQATGIKFDDVMTEGAPSWLQSQLQLVPQLAQDGLLSAIEGGNEEDDPYALANGNSLQWAAQFQQQVWAMGQQYGLPVINMSFGQGWTTSSTGDYGTVGDLSAYTNYGSAHTYPQPGQTPDSVIQILNADAKLAASQRPVITTEIGWQTSQFDLTTIAKYGLDAVMDGMKDGDAGMYFYALYDDTSGTWGMFNNDGTPRPIATAIHNLTTLLADTGANAASFTPGSLNYSLSGLQSSDNTLLIEKSNGSFWLSLWDESASAHSVSLTLPSGYQIAGTFDPLNGTQSAGTSAQITITDHPILVEIVAAPAASTPAASTTVVTTTTTPPATTATSTPVSSGPDTPVLNLPGAQSVTGNSTVAIGGVSITDPWAAANPGTLALNVTDSAGTLMMNGQSYGAAIHINGTLAQLNADLATLSYKAGASAGSDTIVVDVWNQAGQEATKGVAVNVTAPVTPVTTAIDPASYASNPWMQVSLLYVGILGRMPDAGGLTYWEGRFAAGQETLSSIAKTFLGSSEYKADFGSPGAAKFVTELYQNALGRTPDQSGLQYWESQSRPVAAVGIAESSESLNHNASALVAAGLIH